MQHILAAAQTSEQASTFLKRWMLQHIAVPILDLIFPPVCVGCGQVGVLLCAPCISTFNAEKPEKAPVATPLTDLVAVGHFSGTLRKAVHALKYEHATALATPLGKLLAQHIVDSGWPQSILIPVPLHPARLAQRGYNQSTLLAQAAGLTLGWSVNTEVLHRSRETTAQVGLSFEERKKNVKDAFSVTHIESLQGSNIVLVDDVYTTGATVGECAKLLIESGVHAVRALVIGQAGSVEMR